MTANREMLRATNLRKTYPPAIVALAGVDLTLVAGRVHGLLGVNGAGKSTLIKILAGVERPDDGELWLADHGTARIGTPAEAHAAGIGVVHQELPLLPNLTAAENVFLGIQSGSFAHPARRRALAERYRELATRLAGAPPANARLEGLRTDQWQVVGILRALASDAKILILDEPTSSLDGLERAALHEKLRQLADSGLAVLYVSHFLDDVLDICDTVTVLRDARVALEDRTERLSAPALLQAMTGELAIQPEGKPAHAQSPRAQETAQLLQIRRLATESVRSFDLDLSAGDRVGLFGLQGCGAREVLEAVFGLRDAAGQIVWRGRQLRGGTRQRIDAGISYLPPDRRRGLIAEWRVAENLRLPALGGRFPLAPVRRRDERKLGGEAISQFAILAGPDQRTRTLSGGNQQKVSLAKWLSPNVGCLLADEPTRGVDVRGRRMIHEILLAFAQAGNVLLLYSTDPEELVTLCPRVLVMHEGLVVDELRDGEVTIDRLEELTRIRQHGRAAVGAPR
jgi:ABC-type sugar transport system ATPase subunit